jgi:hypothetical protein
MEITVLRRWFTPKSTQSILFINGEQECFVLEDVTRPDGAKKVPGKTAIPAGRYRLIVDWSNRFQKYAFHILDVPNFDGIRIHSGNTDKDTDGCLLVGQERQFDAVLLSHKAFVALWEKLTVVDGFDRIHDCQAFRMKEETWIEIVNDPNPEMDTREAALEVHP